MNVPISSITNKVLRPPAGRLLVVDPRDQLVGDALRRDLLVAEHVVERLLRGLLVRVLLRIDLRQYRREAAAHREQIVAPVLAAPRDAMRGLERLHELVEQAALLKPALDPRDHEVLAEADASIEL